MDVSSILSKILNEENLPGKTSRGINYNDTFLVLNNAKNSKSTSCASLKFLGGIQQMTQSYPSIDNVPLINKFPEIYNMKPEAVAFASGKIGNNNVVVFGLVDPDTQSGQRGLLSYTVVSGQKPVKYPGGAGIGCAELQRIEDYGQAKLSEINKAVLDSFLAKYGSMYILSKDQNMIGNMQNYKKVPLRDLRHNGQQLDWDGDPDGYVWQKIEGGSTKFSDNSEEVDKKMKAQGFTDDQNQVVGNEALMELGFYLKDVMKDLASFQIDPSMVTNKPYWPTEDGGVIIDPTPDQCREFVRLLKACRSNDKSVTSQQCLTGLFQRKLSTIRCNKKGMFKAGGILGLKDDFESLMGDTGKYGLVNLASGLGKVRMGKITAESTLEFKINNLLNEEHRKFSFNEVKKHQHNFNKELVEDFSSQLVLSAYFDLQKSMKKLNRLNESLVGDIFGGLGSNLADKIMGGAKETAITFVIKKLGFKADDFITLLLINVFANLDILDYKEFFTKCSKFTKIIVKSALEAWLDMAMKKIGGGAMEGFVYSALKNTVTETAAQTSVFKRLEGLAERFVCPIVENIDDIGEALI
jgi:hypothetical protein